MPDPKPTIARCESCGARIIWINYSKDDGSRGRMPLNARRVRVYGLSPTSPSEGFFVKEDVELPAKAKLFYVSHFLTCPQASEHSKGR